HRAGGLRAVERDVLDARSRPDRCVDARGLLSRRVREGRPRDRRPRPPARRSCACRPRRLLARDVTSYLEAVRAALADAMREDPRVFLIGEDIGAFGGAFGVTKGLLKEFGRERVIDTPIAEEGFVGAAIGAAWMGERPVVELQFADFVTC